MKYTFVVITEKSNLTKIIQLKQFFLSKIKNNKSIQINTKFIVMNYSNIFYFYRNKIKKYKIPLSLNSKKSLNLKKNYIIKNFKKTYLHFIDDDTNLCPFCYTHLFKYLSKNSFEFVKINRKNVKRFTLYNFGIGHKIHVDNILFLKKLRFILSNSSAQLIFYNKTRLKNFRKDRGLGRINSKFGSENIFISENLIKSKYREIILSCPIEHLNDSTGQKKKELNSKIKSGHLKIIFKNLYKQNWIFLYYLYILYLCLKNIFTK